MSWPEILELRCTACGHPVARLFDQAGEWVPLRPSPDAKWLPDAMVAFYRQKLSLHRPEWAGSDDEVGRAYKAMRAELEPQLREGLDFAEVNFEAMAKLATRPELGGRAYARQPCRCTWANLPDPRRYRNEIARAERTTKSVTVRGRPT